MALSASITHDLRRLGSTLAAISKETGKDGRALVADASVQFLVGGNGVTGMYSRVKALAPDRGRISEVAKLRGYRVKIAHPKAAERALRDMRTAGGSGSMLFRRRKSTFAPSAKKGGGLKRLAYRNGKLVNASSAEAGVSTTEAGFMGLRRKPGMISLNARALMVYYELRAREASRMSLASSYAFAGIRALRGKDSGTASFARRNAASLLVGSVFFSAAGDASYARISNFIPTKSVRLEPLAAATLSQVLADKEAYLSRKILKNFTRR